MTTEESLAWMEDELANQNARLSVQNFLLDILYTNAFQNDPTGFERLMDELVRMSRASPTKTGPMSDEQMLEGQARMLVYLERFRVSVKHRLASKRTI